MSHDCCELTYHAPEDDDCDCCRLLCEGTWCMPCGEIATLCNCNVVE
jgi:hypothetical protein